MQASVIGVRARVAGCSVVFRPMPETVVAWILSGTEKYSDVFIRFNDGVDAGITQQDGVYLEQLDGTNALSLDNLIENHGYDVIEVQANEEQVGRIKAYFHDKIGKCVGYSTLRTVTGCDLFACCTSGGAGLNVTAPELVAGALLWGGVIPQGQCRNPSQLSFMDLYQLLERR